MPLFMAGRIHKAADISPGDLVASTQAMMLPQCADSLPHPPLGVNNGGDESLQQGRSVCKKIVELTREVKS